MVINKDLVSFKREKFRLSKTIIIIFEHDIILYYNIVMKQRIPYYIMYYDLLPIRIQSKEGYYIFATTGVWVSFATHSNI